MPNPQFNKPWHGVSREQIYWIAIVVKKAWVDVSRQSGIVADRVVIDSFGLQ